MRGKRIALIAASLAVVGGQGIQAKALVDGLRSEGCEVDFIPIDQRFPAGLRWLRRIPYLRTVLNQLLYIGSLWRLRRADIAHIFSASYWSFLLAPVPAILAGRLFRNHIVLHYHSGEAEDHLDRWGLLVHPWLHLVDEIVVPSSYLEEIFGRHGYQTRVIPNIVDTSRFRYRERAPLRPLLLSTRNLERIYGVDTVLEAFAQLRLRYPQAMLTVAGSGSEEERLRRLASSLGISPRFLGRVAPEAMPDLYDQADIYVNASIVDNQPVSLLEAFAAGLPVVSSTTGDIPAMLGHGDRGILVPSGQATELANSIADLLESPNRAQQIGRAARQEVERYTWPPVWQAWEQVYEASTPQR